jgi:hypothetical protein
MVMADSAGAALQFTPRNQIRNKLIWKRKSHPKNIAKPLRIQLLSLSACGGGPVERARAEPRYRRLRQLRARLACVLSLDSVSALVRRQDWRPAEFHVTRLGSASTVPRTGEHCRESPLSVARGRQLHCGRIFRSAWRRDIAPCVGISCIRCAAPSSLPFRSPKVGEVGITHGRGARGPWAGLPVRGKVLAGQW